MKGQGSPLHLLVPQQREILQLPSGLEVLQNNVLQGQRVVFKLNDLHLPGQKEVPRSEIYQRYYGRLDCAGWEHSQLLMQRQQEIDPTYRDCLMLFPGTFLGDSGTISFPYIVYETVEWVASRSLDQGVFSIINSVKVPRRVKVVTVEIFE